MVLPDEISDDDSKESGEETNNNLESVNTIDITTFQFRSDLKKEVYRMRIDKLDTIGCSLCQLLYDYNKTCAHYNLGTPKPQKEELTQILAN